MQEIIMGRRWPENIIAHVAILNFVEIHPSGITLFLPVTTDISQCSLKLNYPMMYVTC